MASQVNTNQSQIAALRQQFDELEKLGEEPGAQVAQSRGRQFEALLLDLFDIHRLLLRRSFHTSDNRSEQVDGAIDISGRVALVEAKWTKESLAASDMFAFLGKVEGKFAGTIGVFVSRATLSMNFLDALRHGRRQSILVVHGDDVPMLFAAEFPLREYLASCLRHVSMDNVSHLAVQRFLGQRKNDVAAEKASATDNIRELLGMLDSPAAANLVQNLVNDKTAEVLEAELVALLRSYSRILLKVPSTSPLRATVPRYIDLGSRKLPAGETEADRLFFGDAFQGNLRAPAYHALISVFSPRLLHVSSGLRDAASKSLMAAWDSTGGQFQDENTLVEPTKMLWEYVSADARQALLKRFVEFINDEYHRPGFPQYDLALKILRSDGSKALCEDVVTAMLVNEYNGLLKMNDPNDAEAKEWAWKWALKSFANLKDVLKEDAFAKYEAVARERAG